MHIQHHENQFCIPTWSKSRFHIISTSHFENRCVIVEMENPKLLNKVSINVLVAS
jgi:hypothetical protein